MSTIIRLFLCPLLHYTSTDTIAAMNNLAISFNDLGKYEEALELQEKILELNEEKLDDENSNTIAAMNNLALSLSNLNRFEEALNFQKRALELSKEIHGEEHAYTIAIMNNLEVSLNGYWS